MNEQHVTLNDIEQKALQLGITFAGGPSWFDLDTNASFGLNGTYQKSTARPFQNGGKPHACLEEHPSVICC